MFEHGVEIIAADLAFWSLALKNPSYTISQLAALSLISCPSALCSA